MACVADRVFGTTRARAAFEDAVTRGGEGAFDAHLASTLSWVMARRHLPGWVTHGVEVVDQRDEQAEHIMRELMRVQTGLIRDIFGNPFRPVAFSPAWRTDTVVSLARQMYESHEFGAMPILADALQDAGCDDDDILNHCRGPGPHVRGCWVVDLVLGKE